MIYHAIPVIFGKVHRLSSHGKTKAVRMKWRKVENKLLSKHCPKLYKAIALKIIRERI